MKINTFSVNKPLKYSSTSIKEKSSNEPGDIVTLSSSSSINNMEPVTKTEIQKGDISFCFNQQTSNPLAISGKVMGGTAGALSELPLTPELEFKKALEESKNTTIRYTQEGYKLVDSTGDAYLIRELDQIPRKLFQALFKADKSKKTKEVSEEFTIGHKKPIKTDILLNKIIEVIQEYPEIQPFIGEEHKWSPTTQQYLYYGFWDRLKDFVTGEVKDFPAPLLLRSKLFLLLACGYTNRFAVTAKEDDLEKKLMTYPDGSIQIHDVFRESYLLNKGDLYLTLLTAENMLAKNPYREDRDNDPLQKKLAYIRNDSEPLGDKYGGWYHFFGAALYGLLRSGFTSKSVVLTEAFGSLFLEGPDRQETLINVAGADFGNKLKKMIKKEKWSKALPEESDKNYMNLTEFFHKNEKEV
ncbi:MAG TPA: hypothetical protein PL110_11750 [Candidatus Eremiobacteraeota bacterium]|nr:MAG: hypothetical protein BWY64_03563 [bacterium ADurb.Bin363]HPZ08782.1 hypothetical protein [Candidatus Eremiobacteraeota bacterium]